MDHELYGGGGGESGDYGFNSGVHQPMGDSPGMIPQLLLPPTSSAALALLPANSLPADAPTTTAIPPDVLASHEALKQFTQELLARNARLAQDNEEKLKQLRLTQEQAARLGQDRDIQAAYRAEIQEKENRLKTLERAHKLLEAQLGERTRQTESLKLQLLQHQNQSTLGMDDGIGDEYEGGDRRAGTVKTKKEQQKEIKELKAENNRLQRKLKSAQDLVEKAKAEAKTIKAQMRAGKKSGLITSTHSSSAEDGVKEIGHLIDDGDWEDAMNGLGGEGHGGETENERDNVAVDLNGIEEGTSEGQDRVGEREEEQPPPLPSSSAASSLPAESKITGSGNAGTTLNDALAALSSEHKAKLMEVMNVARVELVKQIEERNAAIANVNKLQEELKRVRRELVNVGKDSKEGKESGMEWGRVRGKWQKRPKTDYQLNPLTGMYEAIPQPQQEHDQQQQQQQQQQRRRRMADSVEKASRETLSSSRLRLSMQDQTNPRWTDVDGGVGDGGEGFGDDELLADHHEEEEESDGEQDEEKRRVILDNAKLDEAILSMRRRKGEVGKSTDEMEEDKGQVETGKQAQTSRGKQRGRPSAMEKQFVSSLNLRLSGVKRETEESDANLSKKLERFKKGYVQGTGMRMGEEEGDAEDVDEVLKDILTRDASTGMLSKSMGHHGDGRGNNIRADDEAKHINDPVEYFSESLKETISTIYNDELSDTHTSKESEQKASHPQRPLLPHLLADQYSLPLYLPPSLLRACFRIAYFMTTPPSPSPFPSSSSSSSPPSSTSTHPSTTITPAQSLSPVSLRVHTLASLFYRAVIQCPYERVTLTHSHISSMVPQLQSAHDASLFASPSEQSFTPYIPLLLSRIVAVMNLSTSSPNSPKQSSVFPTSASIPSADISLSILTNPTLTHRLHRVASAYLFLRTLILRITQPHSSSPHPHPSHDDADQLLSLLHSTLISSLTLAVISPTSPSPLLPPSSFPLSPSSRVSAAFFLTCLLRATNDKLSALHLLASLLLPSLSPPDIHSALSPSSQPSAIPFAKSKGKDKSTHPSSSATNNTGNPSSPFRVLDLSIVTAIFSAWPTILHSEPGDYPYRDISNTDDRAENLTKVMLTHIDAALSGKLSSSSSSSSSSSTITTPLEQRLNSLNPLSKGMDVATSTSDDCNEGIPTSSVNSSISCLDTLIRVRSLQSSLLVALSQYATLTISSCIPPSNIRTSSSTSSSSSSSTSRPPSTALRTSAILSLPSLLEVAPLTRPSTTSRSNNHNNNPTNDNLSVPLTSSMQAECASLWMWSSLFPYLPLSPSTSSSSSSPSSPLITSSSSVSDNMDNSSYLLPQSLSSPFSLSDHGALYACLNAIAPREPIRRLFAPPLKQTTNKQTNNRSSSSSSSSSSFSSSSSPAALMSSSIIDDVKSYDDILPLLSSPQMTESWKGCVSKAIILHVTSSMLASRPCVNYDQDTSRSPSRITTNTSSSLATSLALRLLAFTMPSICLADCLSLVMKTIGTLLSQSATSLTSSSTVISSTILTIAPLAAPVIQADPFALSPALSSIRKALLSLLTPCPSNASTPPLIPLIIQAAAASICIHFSGPPLPRPIAPHPTLLPPSSLSPSALSLFQHAPSHPSYSDYLLPALSPFALQPDLIPSHPPRPNARPSNLESDYPQLQSIITTASLLPVLTWWRSIGPWLLAHRQSLLPSTPSSSSSSSSSPSIHPPFFIRFLRRVNGELHSSGLDFHALDDLLLALDNDSERGHVPSPSESSSSSPLSISSLSAPALAGMLTLLCNRLEGHYVTEQEQESAIVQLAKLLSPDQTTTSASPTKVAMKATTKEKSPHPKSRINVDDEGTEMDHGIAPALHDDHIIHHDQDYDDRQIGGESDAITLPLKRKRGRPPGSGAGRGRGRGGTVNQGSEERGSSEIEVINGERLVIDGNLPSASSSSSLSSTQPSSSLATNVTSTSSLSLQSTRSPPRKRLARTMITAMSTQSTLNPSRDLEKVGDKLAEAKGSTKDATGVREEAENRPPTITATTIARSRRQGHQQREMDLLMAAKAALSLRSAK